jgi:hypothetical protein
MKKLNIESISPSFISGYFIEPSVCDGLIDFFKEENYFPVKPGVSSGKIVDKNCKDSYDKSLSSTTSDKRILNYLDSLSEVVDLYVEDYEWCNITKSSWKITELFNIQYYPPGGGFKVFHFERNGSLSSIKRYLTFMTYLNDVNDGGETEFYYQNLKVKPQKGLTLIWPVDWTHTHRGIPSPSEEKIIVTGWYSFE